MDILDGRRAVPGDKVRYVSGESPGLLVIGSVKLASKDVVQTVIRRLEKGAIIRTPDGSTHELLSTHLITDFDTEAVILASWFRIVPDGFENPIKIEFAQEKELT